MEPCPPARCSFPARPRLCAGCPRTSRGRSTSAGRARARHRPRRAAAEIIEKMRVAGRIAAQALLAGGEAVAPGVTTDEIDRVGARVPRATTAPTRRRWATSGFPKSLLHLAQRGDLPRHPGLDGDRGRRHRQHRRHRVHRRRARRHQRHLPRRRRRPRRTGCWSSAPTRRTCAAIKAVAPGPAAQRDRPGDRVVREAVRLRRGPRLHRPRHRPRRSTRAGHPALRRARVHDRAWSRA